MTTCCLREAPSTSSSGAANDISAGSLAPSLSCGWSFRQLTDPEVSTATVAVLGLFPRRATRGQPRETLVLQWGRCEGLTRRLLRCPPNTPFVGWHLSLSAGAYPHNDTHRLPRRSGKALTRSGGSVSCILTDCGTERLVGELGRPSGDREQLILIDELLPICSFRNPLTP